MDARSRTLARLRSLLALSATAASTTACEHERAPRVQLMPPQPMPYETQGYQTSDPAAPPMQAIEVQARARWLENTWIPRVELTLVPLTTPAELRVVEAFHAKVIDTRGENGALVLTLEPATDDEPLLGVLVEVRIAGDTQRLQVLLHLTPGSSTITTSLQRE